MSEPTPLQEASDSECHTTLAALAIRMSKGEDAGHLVDLMVRSAFAEGANSALLVLSRGYSLRALQEQVIGLFEDITRRGKEFDASSTTQKPDGDAVRTYDLIPDSQPATSATVGPVDVVALRVDRQSQR